MSRILGVELCWGPPFSVGGGKGTSSFMGGQSGGKVVNLNNRISQIIFQSNHFLTWPLRWEPSGWPHHYLETCWGRHCCCHWLQSWARHHRILDLWERRLVTECPGEAAVQPRSPGVVWAASRSPASRSGWSGWSGRSRPPCGRRTQTAGGGGGAESPWRSCAAVFLFSGRLRRGGGGGAGERSDGPGGGAGAGREDVGGGWGWCESASPSHTG